jgi:uncharacterized protein YbjT (DUF2867 family)
MIAITGITGNIGSQLARTLLAEHKRVRAIVRDIRKGQPWADLGCEIAHADIGDSGALTTAFQGVEAVFILAPPNFDPFPGFPEAHAIAAALKTALTASHPRSVVYLSTIGAQATETNLLTQHTIIERALSQLSIPIAFLRPAWFMENAAWDVAPAREKGVIPSFLQPLDKPFPMVGTADIAQVAAELLQERWAGHRIVELEGPARVTPKQIAATFSNLLGHPVTMEVVLRDTWESLFQSQGMKNPTPRIRMLDGFNEGWIEFENGETGSRKGKVALETALKSLTERQ